MFLKELDAGLKKLGVSPGHTVETDSKISSFISLRQDKLSSGKEYVAASNEDKSKLKQLKKEQEESVFYKFLKRNINRDDDYEKLWKKEASMKDNMVSILMDYVKSENKVQGNVMLFFTGHWNRHHLSAVRSLIATSKSVSESELLSKLREMIKKESENMKLKDIHERSCFYRTEVCRTRNECSKE